MTLPSSEITLKWQKFALSYHSHVCSFPQSSLNLAFLLWGSWRCRYCSCASSIPACGTWWEQSSVSFTLQLLWRSIGIAKATMLVSSLVGANISVAEYNKWSGDGELRGGWEVLRSGAKWIDFVGWKLFNYILQGEKAFREWLKQKNSIRI